MLGGILESLRGIYFTWKIQSFEKHRKLFFTSFSQYRRKNPYIFASYNCLLLNTFLNFYYSSQEISDVWVIFLNASYRKVTIHYSTKQL